MNELDSDDGSFNELSDSNMCKINSLFSSSSTSSSSSEEEEVVQPKPDRGRKRTRKALPKRANTDFELGWKEQIQMVQKPAFSGEPGVNKNLHINQDSSPWDIFEIFFSPEMFQLVQKETNRYTMQKINKKKQEGLLKPKSLLAQWNRVSLQGIKKKILFDNHAHKYVMQVISVALLELVCDYGDYAYPMCSFCWNVSG